MKMIACLIFLVSLDSLALTDPTQGKPFFPWLWQDQMKPTIKEAGKGDNLKILGAQLGATLATRAYDSKVHAYQESHRNLLLGKQEAKDIGMATNGYVEIGIALIQLQFDQSNGLAHARALMLTSLSTSTLKIVIRRERPNHDNKLSYPSGHTSSTFATATSLAYAYGAIAGVPAFAAAAMAGLSRIKDERHWASDVVGGAFMGYFWARSSFKAEAKEETEAVITPVPIDDGLVINLSKSF